MAVSRHIGAMPVFWLCVPDPATRGYVERNSIALTSQLAAGQDPPSPGWLGHHALPGQIRQSGLWNVEHLTQPCDPDFLHTLEGTANPAASVNTANQPIRGMCERGRRQLVDA